MFYSPAILAKKGEFSAVWLASHWQHKLSKQKAEAVDIAKTCALIKNPDVPLSLRLSGQLLHGVAVIHQKKVAYLSDDCSDALLKIKMAFRPGVVNLSTQETAATPAKINAPAMGPMDDDMPTPSPRTGGPKNRFAGVEPKIEDDWMKMTPTHTAKRSITRRTPTLDDSDAKSTTTLDEKDSNWSEFPFDANTDASSVELVRKADRTKDSDMASVSKMDNPEDQPYDYQEAPTFDDNAFAPPSVGAGSELDFANASKTGNDADDGLMLRDSFQRSWIDDVAMRENEEMNENQGQKSTPTQKKKKAAGDKEEGDGIATAKKRQATASKRKKKVDTVTELSNEEIEQALKDVSDITVRRLTPRQRVEKDNALRARGFDVRFASVTYEQAMQAPATTGLHPKLVQLFVQNAKPVPVGLGEKESALDHEEDDVELVRAATEAHVSNDGFERIDSADQAPYQYEEVDNIGDDNAFRPSNAGSDGAPFQDDSGVLGQSGIGGDELEVTFRDDEEAAGRESSASRRISPTRTGRGSNPAESSVVGSEGEKWNKQTVAMMKLLREKLSETDSQAITYQELAQGQKKHIVAKAFFEVLQLTTRGMISVAQSKPYGEITIMPGGKYENILPGEAELNG